MFFIKKGSAFTNKMHYLCQHSELPYRGAQRKPNLNQSPYVASSPAGEPKTEIEVACVSASILEVVNLLLRKRTKTEFCPYDKNEVSRAVGFYHLSSLCKLDSWESFAYDPHQFTFALSGSLHCEVSQKSRPEIKDGSLPHLSDIICGIWHLFQVAGFHRAHSLHHSQ